MAEPAEKSIQVMAALAVRLAFDRVVLPHARERLGPVDVSWAPTTVLMRSIGQGDRADLIVAIDGSMDQLELDGIVSPASRVPLADAMLGIAVPAGAPHPDISTNDKFRQALLQAKGVAYSLAGASGIYFQELLQRLDITDAIAGVTIPSGFTAEKLLDGSATIAVQQMSELRTVPGVEIVGFFPPDLQSVTRFSAALFTGARHPQAAALLDLLTSHQAHEAYQAAGLVSRLPWPA